MITEYRYRIYFSLKDGVGCDQCVQRGNYHFCINKCNIDHMVSSWRRAPRGIGWVMIKFNELFGG